MTWVSLASQLAAHVCTIAGVTFSRGRSQIDKTSSSRAVDSHSRAGGSARHRGGKRPAASVGQVDKQVREKLHASERRRRDLSAELDQELGEATLTQAKLAWIEGLEEMLGPATAALTPSGDNLLKALRGKRFGTGPHGVAQ